MKSVLLVAAILLVTLCAAKPRRWHQLDGYTFEDYTREFRKPYQKGTEEYDMRKNVFLNKLKSIQEHNADPSMTWKRGVNEFSDMTPTEWKNYNRFVKSNRAPPVREHNHDGKVPLPHLVDYRTWDSPRVLSDIKHQGACGNCWAHGATETIEAFYSLLTGMPTVFSTQQITSCDTNMDGCNGGDAVSAYDYVNRTAKGLTEEWAYPFVDFFANVSNEKTSKCKNISTEYPAKPYTWFAFLNQAGVRGYITVKTNDAEATMDALATQGPLSISVAAGNWQDYETGVLQNTASFGNFSEWFVDHDVQLVGYGHDKLLDKDYWIVRNSWGTLWGEDGYIRLDRPAVEPCFNASIWGMGTLCGTSAVLNSPHFPLVHNDTAVNY